MQGSPTFQQRGARPAGNISGFAAHLHQSWMRQITLRDCSLHFGQAMEVSDQLPCAGVVGLFRGRFLKPLLIGSSLMLFQQITGQPSVLYYAAGANSVILSLCLHAFLHATQRVIFLHLICAISVCLKALSSSCAK